jgi:aerobic-type carbon monoxide dehydrogenase small subunit (CoxS/CutS family)
MDTEREVTFNINGASYSRTVPVRKLLSEFLRDDLELTGPIWL